MQRVRVGVVIFTQNLSNEPSGQPHLLIGMLLWDRYYFQYCSVPELVVVIDIFECTIKYMHDAETPRQLELTDSQVHFHQYQML
jgi:hypothetical protein